MRTLFIAVALSLWAIAPPTHAADNPHLVVYEGDKGPGLGKHLVFLAGDHEYRSEETLPALARILAKHYGFKCSVFFTTDPKTGFIQPGSSHIAGLDTLKDANLLVAFLRFQDFPDSEMQHIVDYLDRAGPVVGLRTSTHAFQINRKNAKFGKYTTSGTKDFPGGFGRQILGETWVGHYGANHRQSSRLILEPDQLKHPILRGVDKVWVQCGGYKAYPIEGSTILAKGQILDGMKSDAPAAKDKDILPVAWVRNYTTPAGKTARVFATTHGASEDITNEGFRRMLVNACLWAQSMDDHITPTNNINFVGPYQPTTYNFNGYVQNVRPADLAGWTSPIMPTRKK